jgi:hypothetical protein
MVARPPMGRVFSVTRQVMKPIFLGIYQLHPHSPLNQMMVALTVVGERAKCQTKACWSGGIQILLPDMVPTCDVGRGDTRTILIYSVHTIWNFLVAGGCVAGPR